MWQREQMSTCLEVIILAALLSNAADRILGKAPRCFASILLARTSLLLLAMRRPEQANVCRGCLLLRLHA
jgi:hypothetical protein